MNPYDPAAIEKFIQFLARQRDAQGRANLAQLRRAAADPLHDARTIWILGSLLPDTNGWAFDAYRLVATLYALYASRFATSDGEYRLPTFGKEEEMEVAPLSSPPLESSPRKRNRKSFGESLRRLRMQLGAGEESLDRRFIALLDTHREDISVPLRGFIQRLATAKKDIPVDFRQLLADLLYWNGDLTRRQWARDYWQTIAENEPADQATLDSNQASSSIH